MTNVIKIRIANKNRKYIVFEKDVEGYHEVQLQSSTIPDRKVRRTAFQWAASCPRTSLKQVWGVSSLPVPKGCCEATLYLLR